MRAVNASTRPDFAARLSAVLRCVLVAVSVVAVVTAGCASAPDPVVPGQPGSSPTGVARPPGQDDLQSALLTVSDLPPGFTEVSIPDELGLSSRDGCSLLDTDHVSNTKAEATAAFTSGQATVSEVLLQMSTSGAGELMSTLARVPGECAEFTSELAGLQIAFTAAEFDFAPIGEETVAVRLTAQVSGVGVMVEEHVVAVRHADMVLVVSHAAPGSADRAVTEAVTHAAYEKVAQR